jgi:hypothetical protein
MEDFPIQSIPHPTGKQHKFFEKYLDNDLDDLANFMQQQYYKMENLELKNITAINDQDVWLQSSSVSTIKWREYNVFQFYHPAIYKLFKAVSSTVKEACEYYGVDFDSQQYMVQGWFNINYSKKGKLDWHDHGGPWIPYFHGYYCINAEPSNTHYNVFGNNVINQNKNNRMIVSEMGHPHAMEDWDWDGPRVTIAYDIMPLADLIKVKAAPQHWIPLL